MNGPQDLGGRAGFGPVVSEPDEPLWHAGWEPRALALTIATAALGHWTLDEVRHAREKLPPAFYLSARYYDIWLTALEALLIRHGELTPDELAAGHARQPGLRPDRHLPAERVAATLARGGPTERPARAPARFALGDRVRTRNLQPETHTRLPGYAREKQGVIVAVHGAHVFADSHAHGLGENPQWLYGIRFEPEDLWGEPGGAQVHIDAWEPYLEPA